MALVINAGSFLYFTRVRIAHSRKSGHIRKMMIGPVKAVGGDVNRSQLWSSLMSWWCHCESTHHFCSTRMETLQKGVCLCCVLCTDTQGATDVKHQIRMVILKVLCWVSGNVVTCWKAGTQAYKDMTTDHFETDQLMERESYRWWSSMTFDNINASVCNHSVMCPVQTHSGPGRALTYAEVALSKSLSARTHDNTHTLSTTHQ